MNDRNHNNQNGKGPNYNQIFGIILTAGLITLMVVMMMSNFMNRQTTVPYNEFLDYLEAGQIESVTVEGNDIYFTLKSERSIPGMVITFSTVRMESGDQLTLRLEDAGVTYEQIEQNTALWSILSTVLMFGALIFLMNMMMRRMGGGVMGVGKSTAKMYMQKETGVTFADVAGQDEAKESLVESNPSISESSWFNVCSRSSLPPPKRESRLLPMASTSSMKMMHGALSCACLKRSRTRDAPTPTNISTKSDPDRE